jgi:hypothetical protein
MKWIDNGGFAVMLAALTMVSAWSVPATSQEINPLVRERIVVVQNKQERRGDPVRVQLGVNFFLPVARKQPRSATALAAPSTKWPAMNVNFWRIRSRRIAGSNRLR